MSEFHFGVGCGELPDDVAEKIDRIAREHGARFVNPRMPEGPRFWFTVRSWGEPFDSATAREVLEAVRAAGIDLGEECDGKSA